MMGRVRNGIRALFACTDEKPVRGGPAILLYHRIAEERFDPWSLAVSPRHFAEQMEWLARNRTVLPLAEFARRHRDRSLPPDAVAITFDDGYACNAHVAAPVLSGLGLPATMFLPAEIIEAERRFWWDELQDIVINHPERRLRLDDEWLAIGSRHDADSEWSAGAPPRTQRQRAFLTIWSRLRTRTSGGLASALEELSGDRKSSPVGSLKRPMTKDEVRSVPTPVEFGSHALTHRSLPALTATDRAEEISKSLDRCQALAGYQPRTFAYPFGDADADSMRLVEEVGFECACVTGERSVSPSSGVFALPRIGVGDFPAVELPKMLGHA